MAIQEGFENELGELLREQGIEADIVDVTLSSAWSPEAMERMLDEGGPEFAADLANLMEKYGITGDIAVKFADPEERAKAGVEGGFEEALAELLGQYGIEATLMGVRVETEWSPSIIEQKLHDAGDELSESLNQLLERHDISAGAVEVTFMPLGDGPMMKSICCRLVPPKCWWC